MGSHCWKEYVGSHECPFRRKGREHRCYILTDDDEPIVQADPRTRLMDAIEED
jgi:hypothetical protein